MRASVSCTFYPNGMGLNNTPIASLQRDKTLPLNECPGNDTKPSNVEAPALEIKGMWITPSLSLLPAPLWPGVVVHERFLSMGLIKLFDIQTGCKQRTYAKLNCLEQNK